MKDQLRWACLVLSFETCAWRSWGFRINHEFVTFNCKKGGVALWRN